MKSKILLLVGMFVCVSAYGETDYIDMQIHELEMRRDELKKQIAECEQNTRGYKIAGIATLGATGVGVVGNVKLAEKIKVLEQSKSGGGFSGGGQGLSHLSKEQKEDTQCKMFCSEDQEMAELYECNC